MKREEIIDLANGTADAAFVLDPQGAIVAWNSAASELFGMASSDALGRSCSDILHGVDECGRACDADCLVKGHAVRRDPVSNYDVEVQTANGRRWCNMSVLMPKAAGTAAGYTLHIARSADLQKRMERLMRDFVTSENIQDKNDNGSPLVSIGRSATSMVDLSSREIDVLKALAKGNKTADIAAELFISPTTVNNHVQRILKKLNAHTRLEAVRRAEKAGLI